MADLTAHYDIGKSAERGRTMAFPMANGVSFYYGMLCQIQSGYLNHWDDTGDTWCGVLIDAKSRANDGTFIGATGDTPDPEGIVDISGRTLRGLDSVGGSPTVIGALVYGTSSNPDDLTIDPSGRTDPIGMITRFRSATDLDVTLFSMMEAKAQQTA